MELPTIEMERPKAREAFLQYRTAVRERHDAEDEAIMRGYRALARGQTVLSLKAAMSLGGRTEIRVQYGRWNSTAQRSINYETDVHLPRLAIARADAEFAWTRGIMNDGGCEIRSKRQVSDSNRRDRVFVPSGTFPDSDPDPEGAWWPGPRIHALVPTIPPPMRPKDKPGNYHILWEAEWRVDRRAEPPGDPALLKYIGGDLYAVVAVWDLTEVEKAVLAGRRVE